MVVGAGRATVGGVMTGRKRRLAAGQPEETILSLGLDGRIVRLPGEDLHPEVVRVPGAEVEPLPAFGHDLLASVRDAPPVQFLQPTPGDGVALLVTTTIAGSSAVATSRAGMTNFSSSSSPHPAKSAMRPFDDGPQLPQRHQDDQPPAGQSVAVDLQAAGDPCRHSLPVTAVQVVFLLHRLGEVQRLPGHSTGSSGRPGGTEKYSSRGGRG